MEKRQTVFVVLGGFFKSDFFFPDFVTIGAITTFNTD